MEKLMDQAVKPSALIARNRDGALESYVTLSVANKWLPPIWLNPAFVTGAFIVPLYCYASWLNHSTYRVYGARADYLTPEAFFVGLSAALVFILGCLIGQAGRTSSPPLYRIQTAKVNLALSWMGWLALVAYLIFFGALVFQLDLVVAVIKGQRGATALLHRNLGRVPGVTSLMQLSIVGFSLLAGLRALSNFQPRPGVRRLYLLLLVLAFARVLLASERLALIEAAVALTLAPVAFRWKPSFLRTMLPFFGILGIFALFFVAEYFRSWQYYKLIYSSYGEFIITRFFGYFSTSINNGAGLYVTYQEHSPYKMTLEWLWKLPIIGDRIAPQEGVLGYFLTNYASAEYNNPGGLFVPANDYGIYAGLALWGLAGLVAGSCYKSFRTGSLWGLVLYPTIFIGIIDLIRIFYWSDTRTFPIFVGGVILVLYLSAQREGDGLKRGAGV